jgi:hypothetical protein
MDFNFLQGKIITKIEKSEDNYELTFTLDNNKKYLLSHNQDCCESVYIEDICGDLDDLLNSPILLAEEINNVNRKPVENDCGGSWTWTFYKLSTIEGSVTIRWYGTSNGYYSEDVDFIEIE